MYGYYSNKRINMGVCEKHNHFCSFFIAITKKRMSEEKKLNVGLQKYTVLKRDYVHQKHDVSMHAKCLPKRPRQIMQTQVWFGNFNLIITLLFIARNIKCRYFLAHLSQMLKVSYCDRSLSVLLCASCINFYFKRHLLNHWSKFKITSHVCSP